MELKSYTRIWTFALYLLPFLIGSLTFVIWLSTYHGVMNLDSLDRTELVVGIVICGIFGWFSGIWLGAMTTLILSWFMDLEDAAWVMLSFAILFSAHSSLSLIEEMPKVHMARVNVESYKDE